MDEMLKLNDGTVLNGHVLNSSGTLWFYLHDITFSEAYEQMSDPEKTKKITSTQYGVTQVFTGYTDLFCLRRETDGMITGGLKQG